MAGKTTFSRKFFITSDCRTGPCFPVFFLLNWRKSEAQMLTNFWLNWRWLSFTMASFIGYLNDNTGWKCFILHAVILKEWQAKLQFHVTSAQALERKISVSRNFSCFSVNLLPGKTIFFHVTTHLELSTLFHVFFLALPWLCWHLLFPALDLNFIWRRFLNSKQATPLTH